MDSALPSYITDFIGNGSRCKYPSGLYLVGTPIGNMEDVTLRALFTLAKADKIICEDTRVTAQLLRTYGITKPLVSFHEHSGPKVLSSLVEDLKNGLMLTFVSDAGMPLISDPGYTLVQACIENDIYMTTIPGPTAFVSALVLSGFPSHHFNFLGFFPEKNKDKELALQVQQTFQGTSIFYESPHRLLKTLQFLSQEAPTQEICVARELTKLHETIYRGTPQELLEHFELQAPRGEMVLLFAPRPLQTQNVDAILKESIRSMGLKEAVLHVTKAYNMPKNEVYKRALELKADL